MEEIQSEQLTHASIVIEYDEISDDKEAQFRQWQSQIRAGVSQFKGYLKTDICRPIEGLQDKWYIVVHFDSPASLGEWLDSDIRHYLIGLGKKKFGSYRYKIGTGLEGWFSNKNKLGELDSHPPAWKQNFAVLFGLYPTVMLETLLFSHFHIMESWPLAPKMFVNNLVSCSLLTWVVMPGTIELLNFWLKPQQTNQSAVRSATATARSPTQKFFANLDVIGTLLIFAGYGLMISIFHALKF
jgi:hypothetical protein